MCKLFQSFSVKEIKELKAVLLPVGSIEDRGSLPLGLDTLIAERVACLASEAIEGIAVAPSLSYTFSPEHAKSVTVPAWVFTLYLSKIVEELSKLVPEIIFVVAHKGVVGLMDGIVMEAGRRGLKVGMVDVWEYVRSKGYRSFQDLCRAEASVALLLGYSVVVGKLKDRESPPERPGIVTPWTSAVYGCSPESLSKATVEEGKKVLEIMVEAVKKALGEE